MKEINLTPISVEGLDIFVNSLDLRQDLHTFVDYIQSREVKRSHRNNGLPKADLNRLAKLMTDTEAADDLKETGEAPWIYYIDRLALQLQFVSYDTKGIYAGYTSQEPSFPDNYIEFQAAPYEKFLALSLAEQEHWLLERLVNHKNPSASEFFSRGVLSRLDRFSNWGSALGVVPTLDFPEARWFLLDLLKRCQSGVWYSTASLVQYLKAEHPYFLIPKKLPVKKEKWGGEITRYGNFHESAQAWGQEIDISESEPDAFERVEGRYVERFLEDIPLILQYVDVAYGPPGTKRYPSLNALKAFRVNERFLQLMHGQIPEPKVTVQPNFEIHVESGFYPVKVLNQLVPLTNLVTADRVTILKLDRKKVTGQLAADGALDVVELLQRLSAQPLPQNVRTELEEWSGHSEVFTLYEGFGLFEGNLDLVQLNNFVVEEITPTLRLVRSPASVFVRLEEAERTPLLVNHPAKGLKLLPDEAKTLFTRASEVVAKTPEKQAVLLKRETTITLHFPGETILEEYRQAMVQARCPITVDKEALTLVYSQRYQALAESAFQSLQPKYLISIEDIL